VTWLLAFVLTMSLAYAPAFADVAGLKSEPDPERRSELALTNADKAIDAARTAYNGGDKDAEQAALTEVQESVDVSIESLESTHKAPRNNKYYKRAELKVGALLRRLRSLRDETAFEGRQSVEAVIKRLSEVHDQLINAIMSKKK
jgi:hypothetical protein